jgi:membrane protein required for colicin V production
MNWADWLIIAVIAISSFISIYRGFVKEALSLLIWVTAFVIARIFSYNLAELLTGYIDVYSIRYAVAFAILFALALIVGSLINYLISSLVKATGLSGTDRVLGMIFGAARGGLLMVVAVALLQHTPLSNDLWWGQSQLIPQFLLMENWSLSIFKELANYLLNVGQ